MKHEWTCDAYAECQDLKPFCTLSSPHTHEDRCNCNVRN